MLIVRKLACGVACFAVVIFADAGELETAKWQAAIDAASAAGGGAVVVPAGDHPTGMLLLKSNVELRLEKGARLVASGNPADYATPRAVVAAVNDYFSQQERLAADPYLETREKEDAFLRKVLDTIQEGMQASGAGLSGLAALLQGIQTAAPPAEQTM